MTDPIATAPAYRILTPRLVVRCWAPSDAPLLKRAVDESLAHLQPWLDWALEHPIDLGAYVTRLRRDRANFDLDRDYAYGIFDRPEREVLGGIGSRTRLGAGLREIGYWVAAAHEGRGFITEAAAALTQTAFCADAVRRVEIHCEPRNARSAAVARRLGYEPAPALRREAPEPGAPARDVLVWTMNALRFASSPCADADVATFDACGARLL
ncbi:MAG: GNAT family N-acetyltransferase [Polyangiaceae bacterium]|nr:GNAT family N-acetyltransferase [Polyangiaceae bacterium]